MSKAEHVLTVKNKLGEGPLWSPDEQALYWVDIESRQVYRYHPATGKCEAFQVPLPITALGLRLAGGFVAAVTKGFAFWNPETRDLSLIAELEQDKPKVRFNDGAVDRQGRFWAGTMNLEDFSAADGALYRLDPDLTPHKVDWGFTVSNGIGWSPDNSTMYFTDTFRRVILAYDYDPQTGSISNRRQFVKLKEGEGFPDGLTVDAEGFVWSAHWGGWRVTRYDPSGKVDRVIQLPVENVTSCAFGGENLDYLYITTASGAVRKGPRKRQISAGDLFRVKLEVRGIEEPKFTG